MTAQPGSIGGERVRKCDRRIECCGTIDELNASLGWAAVAADAERSAAVHQVQNDLFVIGSHLATPMESQISATLPPLEDAMVHRLEMQIRRGRIVAGAIAAIHPARWMRTGGATARGPHGLPARRAIAG